MIRDMKPEDIDAITDIWFNENCRAHSFIGYATPFNCFGILDDVSGMKPGSV